MSLFTFGVVAGSESLSLPVSLVIVTLLTASYSSEIQATFVNILLFFVSALASTVHSNSIVSESNTFPSYATKLFVPSVINVALFVVVSYVIA